MRLVSNCGNDCSVCVSWVAAAMKDILETCGIEVTRELKIINVFPDGSAVISSDGENRIAISRDVAEAIGVIPVIGRSGNGRN